MQYNTTAIRELLHATFGAEDLDTFCFDNFPTVYERFAHGQTKGARVQMLLEYAQRRNQVADLLAKVHEYNPDKYAEFEARLGIPIMGKEPNVLGSVPITADKTVKISNLPQPAVPAVLRHPRYESSSVDVFFSYSHKDERLRDQLAEHLRALERQQVISAWHDRRISAGTEWAGQIDAHLNTAGIILLLVSASFLNSDYCYDLELTRALERHAVSEARVIPVILRPCDWTHTPFAKLQALPTDGKPVTTWANRDEAFLNITQGIRRVAQELAPNP